MKQTKKHFGRDDSAAAMLAFIAFFPILCMCIGAGVDYARYVDAKSRTKAAIDSAVLAGARMLAVTGSEDAGLAAARKYYDDNVLARMSVTNDTVDFKVIGNGSKVKAEGAAELEMTFLKMAGITSLPLITDAGAGYAVAEIRSGGGSDIEVAVMLDVTGSMCDDGQGPCATSSKLDAMKTAATDLVNIVVKDDQTKYKSKVALVPFSSRIRVAKNGEGATLMNKLTNMPTTWSGWYEVCQSWNQTSAGNGTEGSEEWECTSSTVQQVSNWKIKPCVTERFYDVGWYMGMTDLKPGFLTWLNATDGRRRPYYMDSGIAPMSSGTGETESDPASGDTHYNYDEVGDCWVPEENVIEPLTSDKASLAAKIAGLKGEYGTAGALGTAFAWYMLSPNWKNIWTGTSAPGGYGLLTTLKPNGAPHLRKVAILMSDGVYNTYRSWDGSDQQMVSDYAKQICTNMKNKGIEIFTVAFDLDSLPAAEKTIAEDTLKSCGTDIDHFYNTLNASELQTAFRDIAVKLTSVVLTD